MPLLVGPCILASATPVVAGKSCRCCITRKASSLIFSPSLRLEPTTAGYDAELGEEQSHSLSKAKRADSGRPDLQLTLAGRRRLFELPRWFLFSLQSGGVRER